MNDIFWLRSGFLAGSAGPDRVPWSISALTEAGITRVLSLNDGAMIRQAELEVASIYYECVPLSDNAPPEEGDIEKCLSALPRALEFVLSPGTAREATLVHCSSGKDRTGLFLCYYLYRMEKYTAEAAISEVRTVRPIALTATGWESFAYEVLRRTAA